MCNKCDTPAVPATPLLKHWSERKGSSYRAGYIRDYMQNNITTTNIQYWSHARHAWITSEHPENQERGHKFAKAKAIVNKQASREPMSLQDMENLTLYFKSLEYINGRISEQIEPTYYSTSSKIRNGEWEMLDIMNKLHPYVNNQGSTHDDYVRAQAGFVTLDRLHRIHVSTEDINQIAYYPTLKHMREGREVRTRLGRYLTKYQQAFSLTESDIKNMTEKHASNMRARGGWEVGFVEHNDADGWLNVYRSPDVNSCMQDMEAIRIYAHEQSVLRLAYVKAGERIIARCIVREDGDAKGWLRVYPDPNGYSEGRYLLDYLKTHGYDNHTNLDGVRLRYVTEGNRIVCPYIDCGSGGDQSVDVVHEDGKSYLVAGGCDFSATNTDGFVEDNTRDCDACGDTVDDDETTYIEHDGCNVCEYCRDNNYTYAYGRRYQDYFPEDECIQVGEDYYWLETINDHDIYQCDHSSEYHHSDDLITTIDGLFHSDYIVSLDHADGDGNDYAFKDRVHTLSDGTTCHIDDADSFQIEIDEAEPTDVGMAL